MMDEVNYRGNEPSVVRSAATATAPPAMVEAVRTMTESMRLTAEERSRAAGALEAYAQKADADPTYALAAAMIAHQLRELGR